MNIKRVTLIVPAVALAASAILFAAQDRPKPLIPVFPSGVKSAALAADIFDTIIYLPVKINGHGPYSFILDTGNGGVPIVNEKQARQMGLPLGEKTTSGGAGAKTVDAYTLEKIAVSLGDLGFQDIPAATLPLDLMDSHWGKRKHGLIGGTILSTVVTEIDYAGKSVRFHDPAGFRPPEAEAIPIELYGQPYVRARVFRYGDEKPVEALLMVDTGVRLTSLNEPFSRENRLPAQSPKSLATMTGCGIGGESWGVVGRVKAIEIGSVRIENPVVDFSTDKAGALASDQFSGILGSDVLHRFRVIFDYPGQRMYLVRTPAVDKPYEFDMLGARLTTEGDNLDIVKVFHVADRTPAQTAGLLAGDEIRTIDGRKAAEFNWETLRAYFQQPGKEVRLEIARNGRTFPVKLTLLRLV